MHIKLSGKTEKRKQGQFVSEGHKGEQKKLMLNFFGPDKCTKEKVKFCINNVPT